MPSMRLKEQSANVNRASMASVAALKVAGYRQVLYEPISGYHPNCTRTNSTVITTLQFALILGMWCFW